MADVRDEQIKRDLAQCKREYAQAVEGTPEKYRGFIMAYPNKKKYTLYGQKDRWADLYRPYMTVEGMTKQFTDEHAKNADAIHPIQIDTSIEPIGGDVWVCRATIISPVLGKTSAYAEIIWDSPNRIEKAETKALGRAFRKLGYGIFDGVASADAGEEAHESAPEATQQREMPDMTQSPQHEPDDIPEPSSSGTGGPASPAQWKFAQSLLSQCGTREGDSEALLIRCHGNDIPKRGMSAIIENLKGVIDDEEKENKLLDPYLRQYIKMLCADDKDNMAEAGAYIRETLKVGAAADLTREQQQQLFTYLVDG